MVTSVRRRRLIQGNQSSAALGTFDWYVDSANGSDVNSGKSSATALRTIAALSAKSVNGTRIGFARGSLWREQYNPPNGVTISLGVYGTGAAPIFECADVVTATWTQPDAVTYPNVWSISWTRGWAPSSTEVLFMWVNGALPRDASSLADLQTNGGWWWSSRTTQTATVYIKSATDPNASGVVYELPQRKHGINSHFSSAGVTVTLSTTGPIEARHALGHYGGVTHGLGSMSRLLLRFCGIHHTVTQSDSSDDVICADMSIGYPNGYSPLTAYTVNGAGRTHTARRVFDMGDTAITNNGGLYAHDSTGPGWDGIVFEQCAIVTADTALAATISGAGVVRGLYTNNVAKAVNLGMGTSITVNYSQFRETPNGGSGLVDNGPVDPSSRTRLIEHCVFYGTTALGATIGTAYRNGSLTVRYCTFVMAGAGVIGCSNTPTSLNIDINHCIFIGTMAAGPLYNPFTVPVGSGTLSMDYNAYCYPSSTSATSFRLEDGAGFVQTLAAWQTRSGQDAHSVSIINRPTLVTDLFSGTVANGDFRMKPAATHGLTFSDATPFNSAGPQYHWDWNARAVAAGPASAWPVLPANLTEYRTYLDNPTAWVF